MSLCQDKMLPPFSPFSLTSYTGNFAIASGPEVKLCSLVEKTIPNSGSTYLDIEVGIFGMLLGGRSGRETLR